MEDLEEDRNLGPAEAGHVCDFLCMHGYPIYANWAASETDAMLLPFLGLITRWLGGRDVLFEEFGAPAVKHPRPGRPTLLGEEQAAKFTRDAIESLHKFGLMGAMLWCYARLREVVVELAAAGQRRTRALLRVMANRPFSRSPRSLRSTDSKHSTARNHSKTLVGSTSSRASYYRNPRANLAKLYARFRERFASSSSTSSA